MSHVLLDLLVAAVLFFFFLFFTLVNGVDGFETHWNYNKNDYYVFVLVYAGISSFILTRALGSCLKVAFHFCVFHTQVNARKISNASKFLQFNIYITKYILKHAEH